MKKRAWDKWWVYGLVIAVLLKFFLEPYIGYANWMGGILIDIFGDPKGDGADWLLFPFLIIRFWASFIIYFLIGVIVWMFVDKIKNK